VDRRTDAAKNNTYSRHSWRAGKHSSLLLRNDGFNRTTRRVYSFKSTVHTWRRQGSSVNSRSHGLWREYWRRPALRGRRTKPMAFCVVKRVPAELRWAGYCSHISEVTRTTFIGSISRLSEYSPRSTESEHCDDVIFSSSSTSSSGALVLVRSLQ